MRFKVIRTYAGNDGVLGIKKVSLVEKKHSSIMFISLE